MRSDSTVLLFDDLIEPSRLGKQFRFRPYMHTELPTPGNMHAMHAVIRELAMPKLEPESGGACSTLPPCIAPLHASCPHH